MAVVLKNQRQPVCVQQAEETDGRFTVPLQSTAFCFLRPRKLTDAEKFNIQYPNPAMLTTTADKLRYYRYKKSLLQREVADYAGINESTYIHYENPEHDYYPMDKLDRIAELLEVDITDLLDEYNRFLYDGQGWQIRKIRQKHGLDTVPIRETVWRERRSSKALGKRKSEGDKGDVGEIKILAVFHIKLVNFFY